LVEVGEVMKKQIQGYTREDILRGIEELGKNEDWFHCIDLGNGIRTMHQPLPHLQSLWERIAGVLPTDLSGKSVLDIGCNAGFFSVQAKWKNASHVLGIDMGEGFLKQAEFVRDVLNLNIEYRKMDASDLHLLRETFDVVFCLGVIYHCSNPFSVAQNVAAVTTEMAIVESAVVRYDHVVDRPIWEFVFPGFNQVSKHDRHFNWWFPNATGLIALFRSAGFAEVQLLDESEDRASIVCYK
jgi:tRNA (mo5U34)-methyltransferase